MGCKAVNGTEQRLHHAPPERVRVHGRAVGSSAPTAGALSRSSSMQRGGHVCASRDCWLHARRSVKGASFGGMETMPLAPLACAMPERGARARGTEVAPLSTVSGYSTGLLHAFATPSLHPCPLSSPPLATQDGEGENKARDKPCATPDAESRCREHQSRVSAGGINPELSRERGVEGGVAMRGGGGGGGAEKWVREKRQKR